MFKQIAIKWIAPAVLFAGASVALAEQPVRDLSWFLQRMRSVESLPQLEASHTAMASTWDRTGGNADGADFKNLNYKVTTHGVRAVEGEQMRVVDGPGDVGPFDMRVFGNGWSAGATLWWRGAKLDDRLELSFDVPEAGPYRVVGYFAKAKDYGIQQLQINGSDGKRLDFYDPKVVPSGPIDLGSFDLKTKDNRLTVQNVGGNPQAVKSYMFGLDCLVLLKPGEKAPPQDEIATLSAGRNVLLDIDGPGCIHRIFVGVVRPEHAQTRIQIFLDQSEQPLIDMPMTEFFDYEEGPIPYPLVFCKSYPGTLFPIPYAEHCRIQLVHADQAKPGFKPAAWSNYWQVVHTTYPPGTRIKSLIWPPSKAEEHEIELTCQAWLKAESARPDMLSAEIVEKTFSLDVGRSEQITLDGCGAIRQMQMAVEPATPEVLAGLRMQIAWDGAPWPSVDVPVGSFFGHTHTGHGAEATSIAAVLGRRPAGKTTYSCNFHSLLLGVTDSEAYSCFPMPFRQGAVLRMENRSAAKIDEVQVRLDVQRRDTLPDDWGRFHVTWNERRAGTPAIPKFGPKDVPGNVVLERRGRGKYVGVMLDVDWPSEHWWGEGDWLIWTDEDGWPPSYHGTGSEEYFNSGWCQFDRKAVSGFVSLRPGHPTVYSFHLNDAFQFEKNIRVVEEQMGLGAGETIIREQNPIWGSTAYWYALPASSAESRQDLLPRQ